MTRPASSRARKPASRDTVTPVVATGPPFLLTSPNGSHVSVGEVELAARLRGQGFTDREA